MAEHLANTTVDSIPEKALFRAKMRLIDSIGNTFAGVRASGNSEVFHVFKSYGGAEDATVVGLDAKLPAPHAAFLNALAMRSYDFEAVGAEAGDKSMVAAHISGTTVSVGLAAAEVTGASGVEFLTALILGEDLASRLAVASGFHTASGGDNTGTVNVMGGAAIAGKLKQFTARQYQDAFGHALNQMSGTVQNLFDKALAFKLPQALAARNALFSADLAEVGFTGLDDAIGSKFGFFTLFSPDPNPEALLMGLGEEFYADMIIKPWASCRAAHPALDAVLRLRSQFNLEEHDVESVRIHVTPTTKKGFTGQDFPESPTSEVDGLFSIPYNVAVGLLEGTLRPEHLQHAYMRQEKVKRALKKVELVDSLPSHEYQTAEVVLQTRSGETLHKRVEDISGDIYRNALEEHEVLEKYRLNMEFSGLRSQEQADQLLDAIQRIDQLENIRELTRLLK